MPGGSASKKVTPIIEWQEDVQRTLTEAVECLQEEIKRWNPNRMLVLLVKDDQIQYIAASKERNYNNKDIFWDVTGWLEAWRKEAGDA